LLNIAVTLEQGYSVRKFNLDNVWSSPLLLGVASIVLSALTLMSLIMIFWSTIFPEYALVKSKNPIELLKFQEKEFTPIIFSRSFIAAITTASLELV